MISNKQMEREWGANAPRNTHTQTPKPIAHCLLSDEDASAPISPLIDDDAKNRFFSDIRQIWRSIHNSETEGEEKYFIFMRALASLTEQTVVNVSRRCFFFSTFISFIYLFVRLFVCFFYSNRNITESVKYFQTELRFVFFLFFFSYLVHTFVVVCWRFAWIQCLISVKNNSFEANKKSHQKLKEEIEKKRIEIAGATADATIVDLAITCPFIVSICEYRKMANKGGWSGIVWQR